MPGQALSSLRVAPSTAPAHAPRVRRPPLQHVLSRTEPGVVLVVAKKHVVHLPRAAAAATARGDRDLDAPKAPLYLCEAYARDGACDRGDACDDVHADASQAKRLFPHRRHTDDATSPAATAGKRLPAALGMLEVAFSNEAVATRRVAAGDCLATRALEMERRPPSVCAHFVKKGVCDYGAQCQFVHPLADPEPIPAADTTSSDGYDDAAGSDVAECATMCDILPEPVAAFLPPRTTDPLVRAFHRDPACSTTTNHAWENTLHSLASAPATPPQRYQHDPYGAHGWAMAMVSATSTPDIGAVGRSAISRSH